MSEELGTELASCYSGVAHDVMRGMGLRNFTLPPSITPLIPEKTLCGPAFTIEGRLDETADAHETLLAWTGLLSTAPAGHIWTCQPQHMTLPKWGNCRPKLFRRKVF